MNIEIAYLYLIKSKLLKLFKNTGKTYIFYSWKVYMYDIKHVLVDKRYQSNKGWRRVSAWDWICTHVNMYIIYLRKFETFLHLEGQTWEKTGKEDTE